MLLEIRSRHIVQHFQQQVQCLFFSTLLEFILCEEWGTVNNCTYGIYSKLLSLHVGQSLIPSGHHRAQDWVNEITFIQYFCLPISQCGL